VSKHSAISPSSAGQWVQCPASVKFQQDFPRETDPIAAREGSAAHWLAARALQGADCSGLTVADNGIEITDEMHAAVRAYCDDVERVAGVIHVEQRISCPKIHAEAYGTCDCYSVVGNRLTVWDFKFGILPVSAHLNYQLLMYASGILSNISDKNITEIDLRIIQPRAYNRAECGFTHWLLDVTELPKFEAILHVAAAAALNDAPPAETGGHCRYCRARHACPALRIETAKWAEAAREYSSPQELPPPALGFELEYLQEAAEIIKYRLEALEAQTIKAITAGGLVPGFSVKQTFSREKWTVNFNEIQALGELLGFDLAKPAEAITPTQARKLGLDKEITSKFAGKAPAGLKLVRDNINEAKEVFTNDY